MSNYVFRYYDLKVIKELIKDIGQYEYETNLERMQMADNKPISMKGFYLENNLHCTFLCYKYPSRYILKIMKVDKYNLPIEGWEMVKTNN